MVMHEPWPRHHLQVGHLQATNSKHKDLTPLHVLLRSNGKLAKQQAKRLAQVGLGAFTWDFWTWFTSGNCATVVQSIPNFTNTWSAMPNLGFKVCSPGRIESDAVAHLYCEMPLPWGDCHAQPTDAH